MVVLTSRARTHLSEYCPQRSRVGMISARSWRFGNQDDLADVAPLGDEAVGVGRPVEQEGLGNDWLQLSVLERPYQRLNHPVEASLDVPPGEHVEAKTPLFSFITPSPFHQGIDENGLLASVRSAVATLRLSRSAPPRPQT